MQTKNDKGWRLMQIYLVHMMSNFGLLKLTSRSRERCTRGIFIDKI